MKYIYTNLEKTVHLVINFKNRIKIINYLAKLEKSLNKILNVTTNFQAYNI